MEEKKIYPPWEIASRFNMLTFELRFNSGICITPPKHENKQRAIYTQKAKVKEDHNGKEKNLSA